jgi:hypothetical protein
MPANKCARQDCRCEVQGQGQFCSTQCRDQAAKGRAGGCPCGHANCNQT